MPKNQKEERLREIEREQAALRVSIDDSRRLTEKTQQLLERRKPRTDADQRSEGDNPPARPIVPL